MGQMILECRKIQIQQWEEGRSSIQDRIGGQTKPRLILPPLSSFLFLAFSLQKGPYIYTVVLSRVPLENGLFGPSLSLFHFVPFLGCISSRMGFTHTRGIWKGPSLHLHLSKKNWMPRRGCKKRGDARTVPCFMLACMLAIYISGSIGLNAWSKSPFLGPVYSMWRQFLTLFPPNSYWVLFR